MFCIRFIKTHGTFRCDLQYNLEENTKEILYCNAKLNVISDALRDGVGGLTGNTETLLINQTFKIDWI